MLWGALEEINNQPERSEKNEDGGRGGKAHVRWGTRRFCSVQQEFMLFEQFH